ncbi:MAG: Glu-tRNA(Gln) amidotransferase subunit GatE [Chloroflexia bacterium]|nr:Glu-tRNA(Gln) amidotransferase subunit GatE [Chloroflexia bacterium]
MSESSKRDLDPKQHFYATRQRIGYTPRKRTPPETYQQLGFICGLEVHQQLLTEKKLFCHCPAGIYQEEGEYDAELVRHMRPTLSELGEYDGTALMEFKTKKNIIYRIANETACTYDVDDTPPFKVNRQAIEIALEIALLLQTNIVGELHITRKQYLDGSIPTGFQRTAIIGIEGQIPLRQKTVRIIQLSLEEDSCREVSDIRHRRVYTTDRLGIPLVETVTYPDMKTPTEVAEAAQYIRFLTRSTGKVRTGIGAAREDVNVSIRGGTRVEIKGVAHIKYLPELTHNEAFRQKSLLTIRQELLARMPDWEGWKISHREVDVDILSKPSTYLRQAKKKDHRFIAVNLPGFRGLLCFFSQPGRLFADEISDRLKVIACIEKPNMVHSEEWRPQGRGDDWGSIRDLLEAGPEDAQILFWGPAEDIPTALETIEERCRLAFAGVPNETRKSFPDGTTMFERVLPGPDRMYPDTDSAPIPVSQKLIEQVRSRLPVPVDQRMAQLEAWGVPRDAFYFLLKYNLVGLIERIAGDWEAEPKFVATLLAHRLKHLQGQLQPASPFDFEQLYELFAFIRGKRLQADILYDMLPVVYAHPNMDLESVLTSIDYAPQDCERILALLPVLREQFSRINTSPDPEAARHWIMGKLRPLALGNVPLNELAEAIGRGGSHE